MKKLEKEEEIKLVQRCLSGDEEALEEFVRHFQKPLFNLAYRLCGNRDDAEDIAQESLVRALENLKLFKGESSLFTWLYRITINIFYDYTRKKKELSYDQMRYGEEEDEGEVDFPSEETVERETEKRNIQEIVQGEIAQLPSHYRTVLVLYDIEGFSYDEICAMLQKPLGTVKSRLNRARQLLKQRLEKYRELFEG
jgi:RNA polymerase sigma-70 factor (ECF subfamily)